MRAESLCCGTTSLSTSASLQHVFESWTGYFGQVHSTHRDARLSLYCLPDTPLWDSSIIQRRRWNECHFSPLKVSKSIWCFIHKISFLSLLSTSTNPASDFAATLGGDLFGSSIKASLKTAIAASPKNCKNFASKFSIIPLSTTKCVCVIACGGTLVIWASDVQ